MTDAIPPARVLFLAGFAGSSEATGGPRVVTRDTLDDTLAAVAPRLDLPAGSFAPTRLADFDPTGIRDRLGKDVDCDAVLHHPGFLALESTWRGLAFALERAGGDRVRFEILPVTRKTALERFEDTVFEDEYEDRSEVPLSLVAVDFDYTHTGADLAVLRRMGDLGKALSVPFVASAGPGLFGIKNLFHLGTLPSVIQRFSESPYANFRSFQESPASRWVGLTVNRFLCRPVHEEDGWAEAQNPAHPEWRPWARAIWAAAAAFAGSLHKHGHAADLDGMMSCGDFDDLPVYPYPVAHNQTEDVATEALIPDEKSLDLVHAGVSVLLGQKGMGHAYFPMLANLYRPGLGELTLEASLAHQLLLGDLVHVLLRALPQAPATAAEAEPWFREKVMAWLSPFGEPGENALEVSTGEAEGTTFVSITVRPPIQLHNHDPEFSFDLPLGGA